MYKETMTNSFEIIFDQPAIKKLSEKFVLILFDVRGQELESWSRLKEDAGEQARKVAGAGKQHQYLNFPLKLGTKIICY